MYASVFLVYTDDTSVFPGRSRDERLHCMYKMYIQWCSENRFWSWFRIMFVYNLFDQGNQNSNPLENKLGVQWLSNGFVLVVIKSWFSPICFLSIGVFGEHEPRNTPPFKGTGNPLSHQNFTIKSHCLPCNWPKEAQRCSVTDDAWVRCDTIQEGCEWTWPWCWQVGDYVHSVLKPCVLGGTFTKDPFWEPVIPSP